MLHFEFVCGLTRVLPGKGDDRERSWGIDVYGNGRLIEGMLKQPFGWGTAKMAMNNQANNFIRGELYINGHSFAIPWDTHKREYLADHLVSDWLRARLRPIIKAYITIGGKFASNTDLRKTVLANSAPKKPFAKITLTEGSPPGKDHLPYWAFEDEEEEAEDDSSADDEQNRDEQSDEEDADAGDEGDKEDEGPEARSLTVTLLSDEYDQLLERFRATCADELATAVHDCLTDGVAFGLTAAEGKAALKRFKAESLGELSDLIKAELLKNLER